MYETFFELQRRPFTATPSPTCVVPSESFQAALDELVMCIEGGQGVGILTAPSGMGKTLLCVKLADELREPFRCILLANANFPTRRSLLQAILYELGHPYNRMSEQELRLALVSAARECRQMGRPLVLIVDEAHLLSSRLLEEIRSITNLSDEGEPLMRVVLSGQLQLEEKLAEPDLESLSQRIRSHVNLPPLTRRESADYLAARIRSAGGIPEQVFSPESVEVITQVSDGSPRCLNQLSDHSLLLAFVAEQRPVDVEIVLEALDDLKQLPLHWNEPLAVGLAQIEKQIPSSTLQGEAEMPESSGLELEPTAEPENVAAIEVGCDFTKASSVAGEPIDGSETVDARQMKHSANESHFIEVGAEDHDPVPRPATVPAGGASQLRPVEQPAQATSRSAANSDGMEIEVVYDRYAELDARQAAGAPDKGIVWNIPPSQRRRALRDAEPALEAPSEIESKQPEAPQNPISTAAITAESDWCAEECEQLNAETLAERDLAIPKQPEERLGIPRDSSRYLSPLDQIALIQAAVEEVLANDEAMPSIPTELFASFAETVDISSFDSATEEILSDVYEIGAIAHSLIFDSLNTSIQDAEQLIEPSVITPEVFTNGAIAKQDLSQSEAETYALVEREPVASHESLSMAAEDSSISRRGFQPIKAHGPHSPRKYGRLFTQLRKRREAEQQRKVESGSDGRMNR